MVYSSDGLSCRILTVPAEKKHAKPLRESAQYLGEDRLLSTMLAQFIDLSVHKQLCLIEEQ